MKLDYDGKNFLFESDNAHQNRIIKEVIQAKWNPSGYWVIPDLLVYPQILCETFPALNPQGITQDAWEHMLRTYEMIPGGWLEYRDATEYRKQWDQLYLFQKEEVVNLVENPKRGQMVVLSPGLGKTIVSLVAANVLNLDRVLIITLKDLMQQWCDEEEKWFEFQSLVKMHGEGPNPSWPKCWLVCNYDTVVGNHFPEYAALEWDLVIIDESVLVKNRKTKRFKKLLQLRAHADRWWELTGSPSTRFADDLWSQLHLCEPNSLRSYWRFTNRYCYVSMGTWGVEILGSREDKNLSTDFRDLMFVRNQKDVLSSLPDEIPQMIPVTLGPQQLRAYQEMNKDFVTVLDNGTEVKSAVVISKLIRLQQITSNLINVAGDDVSAKADALIDLVTARAFEFPALIWVNWVPGARALAARLSAAAPDLVIAYIKGAESKTDQEDNTKTFALYKAGKIDLLILSIPVGKFGQNLQMTKTVIWYDKTWMADDFVQGMRRVKRIGLQHAPLVITLKAQKTVDEMVEQNLAGKLPSIAQISNSDLAEMLRNLTGKV